MEDEGRVQQLLDEILDSERSPEEVCAACPELLPKVRRHWQRMCLLDSELKELFPTPTDDPGATTAFPWPLKAELPRIPGYEIDAVLGQGGMAVVYKARHLRLNRPVALKMLLAGGYAAPHELKRFQREAEVVGSLRHPNIVHVYDVGDLEGRPYFTMELVEGGSLAQKLAGTPQPASQAAPLVATLAAAVQVAHQSGIIHRDLKPANVLLTADSTLKISDFGLARRIEGEEGLTRSGARMGTPSYMAPEQAGGKTRAIGPATDVYALGAILYEMLTGRPPFRGETATETELQVICQDPVPPSRLNAKVPRDLETICLKCLQKDPRRRYATAAALADDLRRFQDGRPIQARPLSLRERLWRWCRRNPTAAALVATALALLGLAVGGGLWLERHQAERRAEMARQEGAVGVVLERAEDLLKQGRWQEARAALEGAPSLLDTSAQATLGGRLQQAHADVNMVGKLEEIRLRLSEGRRTPEIVEQLYAEAFQNYGINVLMLEPAESAEHVRNSAIYKTLLAFLHDWLYWASNANRAKLRDMLDWADEDGWRREFREALVEKDRQKLSALAARSEAALQPPVVLSGLGGTLLRDERVAARILLREAYRSHPEDFWINYLLGQYWETERPRLSAGFYQAAIALRPKSDQAFAGLGRALFVNGDSQEAIAAFRRAIELNPNGPASREMAMVSSPDNGLEMALVSWKKSLERDPPDHESWHGYAELCLFLGQEEAYDWARKALLERFGETKNDWVVAERAGLSCLLLPASGEELRGAVKLAAFAGAGEKPSEPANPYVRFVRGLAEYRQGRHKQAVPFLQQAATLLPNRPGPRLVLAMAQFQSGSTAEARKTLSAAIRAYNWSQSTSASPTDTPVVWTNHVLRREAEAMMLPNLPGFLKGEYRPQDNDERLAFLGVCQFERRYAAAARLYADAFRTDPNLADNLTEEGFRRMRGNEHPGDPIEVFNAACRYSAARCAALAGCGRGRVPQGSGAQFNEAERARWRKQAREWLQADVATWAKLIDDDSEGNHEVAKRMLRHWQVDPDLAGLRDPSSLEILSPEEQKECRQLWKDIAAVLDLSRKAK